MKIDYEQMKSRCLSPIASFEAIGDTARTRDGIYVYKDVGSRILAVTHLDTVQSYDHFYTLPIASDVLVYNAQLDDRLGAYVILDLLPRLGIACDVLLTEGEETCHSTARYFQPSHAYNWIFSFDRAGGDTVLYGYDDKPTRKLLSKYEFQVGQGSYSDIADLEYLGCKGFNFGVGYTDNHSPFAHAYMSILAKQAKRFTKFYTEQQGEYLAHESEPIAKYADWDFGKVDNWSKYDRFACDKCHREFKIGSSDDNCVYDYGLCTACFRIETGDEYTDWSN